MATDTQIPAEAPECGEKQEKPESKKMVAKGEINATEPQPEIKNRWSKPLKIAKYFAVIGGVFTLLGGLFWFKIWRLTRLDKFILEIICVIYVLFSIIKYRNKIKEFWKIFPNIFVIIFIYRFLIICMFYLLYLYDPLVWGYISPGLTKEKIMSLKVGDDKESIIKLLGDPAVIISPYEERKKLQDRLPYSAETRPEVSDEEKKLRKFIYAFTGTFETGFELNIYVIDDKMTGAVMKRNAGDYVYRCGDDACPVIFDQYWFDEFFKLSKKSKHKY